MWRNIGIQFDGTFLVNDPEKGVVHFRDNGNIINSFRLGGNLDVDVAGTAIWDGHHYIINDSLNLNSRIFNSSCQYMNLSPNYSNQLFYLDGMLFMPDIIKLIQKYKMLSPRERQSITAEPILTGLVINEDGYRIETPFLPFCSLNDFSQIPVTSEVFSYVTNIFPFIVNENIGVIGAIGNKCLFYNHGGQLQRQIALGRPGNFEDIKSTDYLKSAQYIVDNKSIIYDAFSYQNLIYYVYTSKEVGPVELVKTLWLAYFDMNGNLLGFTNLPEKEPYIGSKDGIYYTLKWDSVDDRYFINSYPLPTANPYGSK